VPVYSGSPEGQKPTHSTTGIRGYLGNRGSVFESRHIENAEPRVVPTTRWCTHRLHSPAGGP
jgi:hypothetical protein